MDMDMDGEIEKRVRQLVRSDMDGQFELKKTASSELEKIQTASSELEKEKREIQDKKTTLGWHGAASRLFTQDRTENGMQCSVVGGGEENATRVGAAERKQTPPDPAGRAKKSTLRSGVIVTFITISASERLKADRRASPLLMICEGGSIIMGQSFLDGDGWMMIGLLTVAVARAERGVVWKQSGLRVTTVDGGHVKGIWDEVFKDTWCGVGRRRGGFGDSIDLGMRGRSNQRCIVKMGSRHIEMASRRGPRIGRKCARKGPEDRRAWDAGVKGWGARNERPRPANAMETRRPAGQQVLRSITQRGRST
ncbi:hypothetical protein B0H19DRAFT_1073003 [Mycena capillaripes]|nr:hypothetical protein B0H19DRAFT_1073003 [Mycena capillaripes]